MHNQQLHFSGFVPVYRNLPTISQSINLNQHHKLVLEYQRSRKMYLNNYIFHLKYTMNRIYRHHCILLGKDTVYCLN